MIHLCSDSFFRAKFSASALLLQSYKCLTAGVKVAGSNPAWCQFFDVYLSSPFYIICYSAPCPETVEELARMKLLVKNVAIIKANLGTWKPTSPTDFPAWESVAKCKLFTDAAWTQFATDLGKPLLNYELKPATDGTLVRSCNWVVIAIYDLFFALCQCVPSIT
jgi:hypothetical protein